MNDTTWSDSPEGPMNNLGMALWRLGRYSEAEALFFEALGIKQRVLGKRHPETATALYNLACISAVHGDAEGAVGWLDQAVEAGYAKPGSMLEDSDLQSLHGDPVFDALVERARQNAAAQRAD